HLSHGAHRASQAVLRALPPPLRLGRFHGLRRLQRYPLHVWNLQLRLQLAPAQSRLTVSGEKKRGNSAVQH
ncbi:MAG TPA: hypothetical protein VJ299_18130, partial [Steroidobacteraceae bacterium]|nr:hypothetical protein [Steroidobacteraceae bacterium]